MARVVVLGGGRMGAALVGGLLRSGYASASDIAIVEKRAEARSVLVERFPGIGVTERADSGESLVLAIKPQDAEAACRALAPGSFERVLSIVAGAPIAELERWLWPGAVVIRAMPNTPALIGSGASAIAPGSSAKAADLEWAEGVLSALGVVVSLPEHLIDAVTGLSGSGPAYVFLLAEALIEAGVLAGLDREVARVLTVQTILGSAKLLAETGETPEVLRHAVTSPGGTTAAGLHVLEQAQLRAAIADAVMAAARRSKELGERS